MHLRWTIAWNTKQGRVVLYTGPSMLLMQTSPIDMELVWFRCNIWPKDGM
jgi:hypothetical protein